MVSGWWRWWRRVELVGTPGAHRLRLRVSRSEDQGRRMLENGKGLGLEWKRELGAAVTKKCGVMKSWVPLNDLHVRRRIKDWWIEVVV